MPKSLGQLERLKISGYKSIQSLDIELKSLNILIGANGSGKSNLIGFFKFMKKIIDKDLPLYVSENGGANKQLYFGSKTTDQISFALLFPPNGYKAVLIPDVKDNLIFKSEKTYFFADQIGYHGGTKTTSLNNNGESNSKLPNWSSTTSIDGQIVGYLKDWKVYHFHDTSSTAKVKQICNINDYDKLATDGANLAAFLNNIQNNHEKSYNKIIKTINRVAPFFQNFILEPESNNKDTIRLKWKHQGTDDFFDASDLSDGTLRFICLATLLLQPNLPTIILLDEPELGLHPFALRLLAGLFRKISRKTQIISTTQSITLADNFDIEDIIVVDRKNNQSVFQRLDVNNLKEWLEDYSVGEIWQKNLIGGVPNYD